MSSDKQMFDTCQAFDWKEPKSVHRTVYPIGNFTAHSSRTIVRCRRRRAAVTGHEPAHSHLPRTGGWFGPRERRTRPLLYRGDFQLYCTRIGRQLLLGWRHREQKEAFSQKQARKSRYSQYYLHICNHSTRPHRYRKRRPWTGRSGRKWRRWGRKTATIKKKEIQSRYSRTLLI